MYFQFLFSKSELIVIIGMANKKPLKAPWKAPCLKVLNSIPYFDIVSFKNMFVGEPGVEIDGSFANMEKK